MSYWGGSGRTYFAGVQNGNDQQDAYGGGQQYESAGGGKKRSSSRLKKSSKKAEDDDEYPKYTTATANGTDDNRYNGDGNYGSNSASGALDTPYYGGGGGHGSSSAYGNGGYVPYGNLPASFWATHDGNRSPMVIHTKEVHVHGMPGYEHNNDSNDERRGGGGGGGGFFGPAFHAVGHFFDRKFGLNDRN